MDLPGQRMAGRPVGRWPRRFAEDVVTAGRLAEVGLSELQGISSLQQRMMDLAARTLERAVCDLAPWPFLLRSPVVYRPGGLSAYLLAIDFLVEQCGFVPEILLHPDLPLITMRRRPPRASDSVMPPLLLQRLRSAQHILATFDGEPARWAAEAGLALVLFGSVAEGTWDNASDIDLALIPRDSSRRSLAREVVRRLALRSGDALSAHIHVFEADSPRERSLADPMAETLCLAWPDERQPLRARRRLERELRAILASMPGQVFVVGPAYASMHRGAPAFSALCAAQTAGEEEELCCLAEEAGRRAGAVVAALSQRSLPPDVVFRFLSKPTWSVEAGVP